MVQTLVPPPPRQNRLSLFVTVPAERPILGGTPVKIAPHKISGKIRTSLALYVTDSNRLSRCDRARQHGWPRARRNGGDRTLCRGGRHKDSGCEHYVQYTKIKLSSFAARKRTSENEKKE